MTSIPEGLGLDGREDSLQTELTAYAETANTEHSAYVATQNAALTHAIAAGDALTAAKRLVGHGGWQAWVAANCVFGHTTATNYTRIAANKQRVADMGLRTVRAALAELASKEHVREDAEFDWEWSPPCTDWAEPPGERRAVTNHPFGREPFAGDPRLWSPAKEKPFPKRGRHYENSPWVCPRCGHGKTKHDPPIVDLYGWAP